MSNIRVISDQQNVKVRVGQQNAVKVTASISGSNTFSETSQNVIGGIASVTQLSVSGTSSFSGISTFFSDVTINGNLNFSQGSLSLSNISASTANITGILTVGTSLYYSAGQPYGIAYFDQNDLLVSTGTTSTAINETYYILSTNSSGVPSWSNTIDGGVY